MNRKTLGVGLFVSAAILIWLVASIGGLSVNGTVKHDYYISLMGGIGGGDEYHVQITVKNWNWNPINYDAVRIFYDTGDGEGLSAIVVNQNDGLSDRPIATSLGFLQTHTFLTETDGYTMRILQHTKTGKVALHVAFLNDNKVIDHFHAVLPSLIEWDNKPADLPLLKETSLHFTRDYDAVMKEVKKI